MTAKTNLVPAGSVVEYCGEIATVVQDRGDDVVVDDGDGIPMRWYWKAYGCEVKVLSLQKDAVVVNQLKR